MNDATRIKELLREHVTKLVPYLFPNGKREGNHWCVGDISGAPGQSFKICIAGEKAGLWGDFADSEKHSRSLLDLWMRARDVDFKTALREAAEWLGQSLDGSNGSGPNQARVNQHVHVSCPAPKALDWQACVDAFTGVDRLKLVFERGYSRDFISWLRQSGLVGKYRGCFAFPVHDRVNNVVAIHYRLEDGSWRYHPQGARVNPLVVGELAAGDPIHLFESQWDCFAAWMFRETLRLRHHARRQ